MLGEASEAADEFTLLLPKFQYTDYYGHAIGDTVSVKIEAELYYTVPIGTLVGVAVSDKVNTPYLMAGEYNETICEIIRAEDVILRYESVGKGGGRFERIYDEDAEKSYFAVPCDMKDDITFNFSIKDMYGVHLGCETVYTDDVKVPTFVIGGDYIKGNVRASFDGVKEITVYDENVKKLSRKVSDLGYGVSIPAMTEDKNGANLFVLYFLIGVSAFMLVILFYVSFSVMQRIYSTKTKDYSIFRTLGIVSRDLKKILHTEVLLTAVCSSVTSALISNFIIIFSKIDLYKYVSLPLIVIYAAVMVVFSLMTSARLNGKIFKNSVYQTIKEGGEQV
jgi:ABC-type antimicrobial peptide transport system permease subunit